MFNLTKYVKFFKKIFVPKFFAHQIVKGKLKHIILKKLYPDFLKILY